MPSAIRYKATVHLSKHGRTGITSDNLLLSLFYQARISRLKAGIKQLGEKAPSLQNGMSSMAILRHESH